MKKLSKIGIGILLGYLLSNAINEADFERLKISLLDKAAKVQPKLTQYFYELNNIVNATDNSINVDIKDPKILAKLREIQNEIEDIKGDEMAQIILDNLKESEKQGNE